MNVNSVDNFLNWSGTRKTETKQKPNFPRPVVLFQK